MPPVLEWQCAASSTTHFSGSLASSSDNLTSDNFLETHERFSRHRLLRSHPHEELILHRHLYLAAAWLQRRCSSRVRRHALRACVAIRGHACERLPPRPMRAALHGLGRSISAGQLLVWLPADKSLEVDCKLRLGEPHAGGCAGGCPSRGDRDRRPFGAVGVHQLQLPGQRWMLRGEQVGATAAELRAVPAVWQVPVSDYALSEL